MFFDSILAEAAKAYHILQLRRNQWKSSQELKDIQWRGLKNIVHYVYGYIPYYRKLFRSAKFKPGDLRSLNDLRNIPKTTKNDIRRNYQNIIANGLDPSKGHTSSTSGSTGTPLKIVKHRKAIHYEAALVDYAFMECGYRYGEKFIHIMTRPVPKQARRRKFPPNIITFETRLESGEQEETIKNLWQIEPDVIYTMPWMINALCSVDVSGIELKLIFSHGETLTEHTRDLVRSKLGIEVNNTYGSAEFYRLAFECNEHSGMHMITDCAVMEIIDDDGEPVSLGETGEIIVTGLDNYAMPLIRYEIGDLGVPSDEICSCGRRWPLIKSIEGRTFDVFTLESGRKLYSNYLHQYLKEELKKNIFCVSEYQMIQEKRDEIMLKFVRGRDFDRNIIDRIKGNMENDFLRMDENVSVEIQFVKEIPIESSGKKRSFLSLIN